MPILRKSKAKDDKNLAILALRHLRKRRVRNDRKVKKMAALEKPENLPNASVQWTGEEPVPYQKILQACQGRPNMLFSIGWTGLKSCYLNIPVKEAIERYKAERDDEDIAGVDCELIAFTDSFNAYQVG